MRNRLHYDVYVKHHVVSHNTPFPAKGLKRNCENLAIWHRNATSCRFIGYRLRYLRCESPAISIKIRGVIGSGRPAIVITGWLRWGVARWGKGRRGEVLAGRKEQFAGRVCCARTLYDRSSSITSDLAAKRSNVDL